MLEYVSVLYPFSMAEYFHCKDMPWFNHSLGSRHFLGIVNNAEYPSDIMKDAAMSISHNSTHIPPFLGSR